ncbi:YecH family metal-binding protein [Vibrio sonorensis]|uniref:YecH family metal-binding protein n=1 Tax=Vibrio sonorensis TaxID=1004316 RepID=UPI0008DA6CF6|nr:YecH family metal-binding protein [Vibrio sonorensis]
MANRIHAHSVLNLLQESPMTKDDLTAKVLEEFGADALFHTCSLSDLDFDTLFSFFVNRQKIVEAEGKWALNAARVCNH